jgi:spermidine synthase
MNPILVLGIAERSVIKTLVHEVGYAHKITGVEIDSSAISIANTYFELAKISNFDLVLADAFEFVLKTKITYNLIISTIFQETKMLNFLFEKFFVNRSLEISALSGMFLFNTVFNNFT